MATELFRAAIGRLADTNLTPSEVVEAAAQLKAAGGADFVAQLYTMWLSVNPSHPLAYVIHFNLAVQLDRGGDLAAARTALMNAQAANPDFLPAYINLGGVLEKTGAIEEAITQWRAAADKLAPVTGAGVSYKIAALKQIGRVLEGQRRHVEAEAVLRQSLEIDPHQPDVLQHYLSLRMAQCSWPVVAPFERVGRDILLKAMSPLSMAVYTDDPMLQLATAAHYNRTQTETTVVLDATPPTPAGRLRVGYVSSDLREHAIGFLMAEMMELHRRDAVEVFVYYCGIPASDAINARIKAAVEHWVDISGMDDETAARRVAADGIHILVDVNGYTRDARTRMFAMRPAPIAVNWLGFPGTMGSPYHQYLIADDWVIPEGDEVYYAEKVVRLPCYQPNDRKRVVAALPSRRDAGLPDEAMVYCCFNGLHKISRFTFERWMAILARVPDSVLWLLDEGGGTALRLRSMAEAHGVAGERLVFAPKLTNPFHLARYPLADLFLDTAPYGAHTTASDALWMGVPMLTLSGTGFASRVCGSLVRAAGLPDLICDSPADYVERAVALGSDRAAILEYKNRLAANRDSCTLFDMDGLVAALEGLYRQMWDGYREGRLPQPDLANMDVYQEVGIATDHEAVEVMAIPDYRAWNQARLASRHALRPIPEDRRLWTAADRRR